MTGSGGPDRGSPSSAVDRRAFLRAAGVSSAGVLAGMGGVPTAGAADGNERWRFETGDAVRSSPTVVDGTAFVGSDDGNVYALDAATGDERWRATTDGAVFSSPTVVDDTVYVGSEDNYLHAFEAGTGDREWQFRTSFDVTSSPTVADGTVVVGSRDDSVYGVDAASDEERWEFPTSGLVYASPTIHDGTVYVGSWDSYLYAIDLETGDERWSYEVNGEVYSSATVADGILYVGTHGNSVYALDAETGEGQWRRDAADSVIASPTVYDGTVYVASWDHRVYAIDAESGERQWRYDAGSRVGSSPTIADGTVFVGTTGEALAAIDAETGEEQWRFATGGTVDSSPVVVDGTVYVGCADGNVYAVRAGVAGSSEGSRVESGTLGHHHAWAGQGASGGGSGTDVSIENLRLVQTVENTRAIDGNPDLHPNYDVPLWVYSESGPASETLIRTERENDWVTWTAPDPDVVAGRMVAPVFDLDVANPESIGSEVQFTAEVYRDGWPTLRQSAQLDPDAVAGRAPDRRNEIETDYGMEGPEQLPLLDVLAGDRDLVSGEYPTFPAGTGLEVAVEIDGPDLEDPVVQRVGLDDDRIAVTPTLTVGFVGIENPGTATFEGDPDVVGFAEDVAEYFIRTFPTYEVEVAAIPTPYLADHDGVNAVKSAVMAERVISARIDEADTFRLTAGGGRSDDVSIASVDVTIGVMPANWPYDRRGLMPIVPKQAFFARPAANAGLAEISTTETVAPHEAIHFFLWRYYSDPSDLGRGDSGKHASDVIACTGYDFQLAGADAEHGDFDVLPGHGALVGGSNPYWLDSPTYQGLIDCDFEPVKEPSHLPDLVSIGDKKAVDRLDEVDRRTETARAVASDSTVADVDDIQSSVATFRSSLTDGLDATEAYWELPDGLDTDGWEQLRDLAGDVETVGETLQSGDLDVLEDGTTRTDLGERLIEAAGALGDYAAARLSEDVRYVLEVTGTVDGTDDLDYDVLPVIGLPESPDWDGSIAVRSAAGETITDGSLATGAGLIGQDGDGESVENVVYGTVELPDDAATVAVTADGSGTTVSTEFDPTVDPIRETLESLPDRAFDGDLTRSDALERLDRIGTLAADGDHDGAAEELESLYRGLHETVPGDYTPQSADEPTSDRVLALVGQQLQRFGGEVPHFSSGSDDLPRTWLAAGAGAGGALLGTYALKRAWDRRGEESAGD